MKTLTGSCDSKGLFKAKNPYLPTSGNIIQVNEYNQFGLDHPELFCYTPSNELVTDVENVEVVKGYMGLYGTIWQTIPEHAYKQFLFNQTGYQMSKVMQVYITVPPTETLLCDCELSRLEGNAMMCFVCSGKKPPYPSTPLPKAQPLEEVKTAQSILSATGKTISTITHIELLQCMEEYANYRIAQFETGTRHHLTDEELLKAMQDYHRGQLGTDAVGGKESMDDVINAQMLLADSDVISNRDFTKRCMAAYAAPSTHSSSEMVEELQGKAKELSERLKSGRDYLMSIEADEFNADDALLAFGYTTNGF